MSNEKNKISNKKYQIIELKIKLYAFYLQNMKKVKNPSSHYFNMYMIDRIAY